MPNANHVTVMGNLTRDPEIKYTPKGTPIAEFGLAINRYYTPENGERQEQTTFVDITLYGRTAEIAKDYLGKGKPVYIEGRLHLDTWDDKETGQKRSKLKVIGENLQLIEKAPQGENGGGSSQNQGQGQQRSQGQGQGGGQRPQGGGAGGQRPSQQPQGGGNRQQPQRPSAPAPTHEDDDDIPF